MFSLQVDDVPPKAEAVTVDAKHNVSTQTKRRNSPDVVEATREGRNARLLSIKTLSQKVDRRLQTRKTINHRRRNGRSRSRDSRRIRPRSRDMPARIATRTRGAAISSRRTAIARARAPTSRPKTRRPTAPRPRGRTRTNIFRHFSKAKSGMKKSRKNKKPTKKALVESRDNTCERENKK